MNLEAIIKRMKEIKEELRNNKDVDIEALRKEFEDLKEQKNKIESDIEERKKLLEDVANSTDVKVLRNFLESDGEKRVEDMEKEYRNAFLKNLMGQHLTEAEERAFVHTTENTAAVVPQKTLNMIYTQLKEVHPILDDIQYLRSNAVISIPVHKTIDAGDAKVVAEGEANEDEQNTFAQITLAGKDFSKHVDFSYRLGRMSIDAFEEYLAQEIADRLAAALADDVIAQVKTGVNAANKIDAAELEDADVRKAFGSLRHVGAVNVYANNTTIWNIMAGLKGEDGKDAFLPNYQDGLSGRLYGRPVKEEDGLTDGEILIMDSKQYLFNEVQPILLERDKNIKRRVETIAGSLIGEGALTNDKAAAIITVTPGA